MKKINNNSPVTAIRLDEDDLRAVEFVREKLSAPGYEASKSDALRRALHEFANRLRAKDQDRRKEKA